MSRYPLNFESLKIYIHCRTYRKMELLKKFDQTFEIKKDVYLNSTNI